MERSEWPKNDPTIIAEGVFAVANVFSFARIIYLFQTNPHLGPLQISLGCMIIDIAKFLFIFFLVLTSFACGMNQLYWYYDSDECTGDSATKNGTSHCDHNPEAFMTIDASYASLLWSLFGVIPLKDLRSRDDQAFLKWVGHALLGAYLIMAITVMVNMLIAMMSRSFQDIEDHADREWKFARSKLWMSYFDEGSTLPAPFNLIVSPKAVYYFLVNVKDLAWFLCTRCSNGNEQKTTEPAQNVPKCQSQNGSTICINKGPAIYQEVMKRLVRRYIHQIKMQLRQDGVNEDDLLEIKQDISSLRYELREDRKREAARCSGHIECIKRDIIRALRGSSPLEPSTSQSSNALHPEPNNNPRYSPTYETAYYNIQPPGSLLSSQDLDILKREIVATLRSEMKSLIREATAAPAARPAANNATSDLYHTHLFTQL